MANLQISISKQTRAIVVKLAGRMDASSATELQQSCGPELAGGNCAVVLDLAGLRYISSAGLRSVLWLGKACEAKGQRLSIAGLNGGVKEVFALSGFDRLFLVCATAEDALAS